MTPVRGERERTRTSLSFSSHFREVDEVEARLWAELHGFTYFETSANNGLGVTDMFQVRDAKHHEDVVIIA